MILRSKPLRVATRERPSSGTVLQLAAFILIAVPFLLALSSTTGVSFAGRDLIDTDGYMRVVRVTRLLETGDWYDGTIPRSNYPFGEMLHWTRPFDVFLLILALPLRLFGDRDDAIYWAAVSSGPILLVLCGLAFAWAQRHLTAPDARGIAIFGVLTLPAVLAYATPGRADHHLLVLLGFIVILGCALRILTGPGRHRAAIIAGITVAGGIWVSTEFLLPFALILAVGLLQWIRHGRRWAPVNLRLAATAAIGIALALVIERDPGSLAAVEYDRISIVHLVIALLAVGFWIALSLSARAGFAQSRGRRLVLAGTAGALALATLIAAYPRITGGPLVDVNPEAARVWQSETSEFQPLLQEPGDLPVAITLLFWPVIACFVVAWLIARSASPLRRRGWTLVATWLVLYFTLTLASTRFIIFAELLAVLVLLESLGRLLVRLERRTRSGARQFVRAAVTALGLLLLFSGGMVLAAAADPPGAEPAPRCAVAPIAPALRNLSTEPLTILASVNYGPELLYRTQHNVIATPYHRNHSGILDAREILRTSDIREQWRLVEARSIDVVLICPGSDAGFIDPRAGSLYDDVLQAKVPEWLTPVSVAALARSGFLLFRIVQTGSPKPDDRAVAKRPSSDRWRVANPAPATAGRERG